MRLSTRYVEYTLLSYLFCSRGSGIKPFLMPVI